MEVKLNDIGEGMTEAHISHYFVKPGDVVVADQPLVEVQTDKMTAEIPSPINGIIQKLLVSTGKTVPVGTTIITISEEKKKQEKKRKQILASPYTRKMARELGVLLENIQGSGISGRITDEDVQNYADEKTAVVETVTVNQPESSKNLETTNRNLPFRGRRKQIAHKMKTSLRTIPHCTSFEEIDVTNVFEVREQLKAEGVNISIAVFFLKALSLSLKEYPIFNSTLDEENEMIHLHEAHHFGIAIDTEDGLIAPVLSHVEKKSIRQLQAELKDLTQRTLQNQLTSADLKGGTFTVSNVGPLHGSIGATPIINPPEAALIAFHKTKKRPMVNDTDDIVIRKMMNISFSFDHRVADGGTAVKFTNLLTQYIENPSTMLVELM
ncbi:dihydrolipoamide acetyltransferase family protein [Bacillus spongiae]|uniref:Dihydrolipoamide acetyltransferase component of pyruvate dehydrogenase complex n=1 Tax=Bacillus spongiae TaxID=2683610 RepID=A0ABU8HHZ3_9BACI